VQHGSAFRWRGCRPLCGRPRVLLPSDNNRTKCFSLSRGFCEWNRSCLVERIRRYVLSCRFGWMRWVVVVSKWAWRVIEMWCAGSAWYIDILLSRCSFLWACAFLFYFFFVFIFIFLVVFPAAVLADWRLPNSSGIYVVTYDGFGWLLW